MKKLDINMIVAMADNRVDGEDPLSTAEVFRKVEAKREVTS